MHDRGPDMPMAVGGNGDSYARATDEDAEARPAIFESRCHAIGEIGVVDRRGAFGTQVQGSIALFGKRALQGGLQLEAGVIASNCNGFPGIRHAQPNAPSSTPPNEGIPYLRSDPSANHNL